jgi:hypothetical protein
MPRPVGTALAFGVAIAVVIGAAVPARAHGTTERVNVGPGGVQANDQTYGRDISADGGFVAFETPATNLVEGDTNGTQDVFLRDRQTGTTERVSVGSGRIQANDYSLGAALSADARFVLFSSVATNLVSGDTNRNYDSGPAGRRPGLFTTARLE